MADANNRNKHVKKIVDVNKRNIHVKKMVDVNILPVVIHCKKVLLPTVAQLICVRGNFCKLCEFSYKALLTATLPLTCKGYKKS